jgi:hypothetical protein
MRLTDSQLQTCINALKIAAEACEHDAAQCDAPIAPAFLQSARTYRALAELLEAAPAGDEYGCTCSEWERHNRVPHRACPVHWIGPLERRT